MSRRRYSLSGGLGVLWLAVAGLTGCGDNLSAGGGGGSEADAGPAEPDAGGGPDAAPTGIITCEESIPAASEGACDVTPGDGSAVLLRGTVLGRDVVYENGAVLYDGARIVCVGCDCGDEQQAAEATRMDCADAVISPGLINPHDHITFTEGAPIDHGDTRYDHRHDWRGELPAPSNPHGTGATSAGNRWGELRMLLSGVTSMVGSGRADGLVRNLDQLSDDRRGARARRVSSSRPSRSATATSSIRADCGWNYSPRRVRGRRRCTPSCRTSPRASTTTRPRSSAASSTSFGGGQDFTEKNAAHIHAIGLDAADYATMARDRDAPHLVAALQHQPVRPHRAGAAPSTGWAA